MLRISYQKRLSGRQVVLLQPTLWQRLFPHSGTG